jgi:hypothetical protein
LVRPENGGWKTDALVKLDAGPQAATLDRGFLYVVTPRSLMRVDGKHAKSIYPLRLGYLYPNSLAVDASGAFFMGMRHFVLQLTPKGDGFDETWMVPKGCERSICPCN